jgi:hypothetical protein
MALVAYPANLPIPDIAVQGQHFLPLSASSMDEIGAYESYRNMTRPYITASSGYLLEPSECPIFLAFYNTTLNKGVKYFTADWIEWLGLEGYRARITGFRINLKGTKPNSSIELEFCPYLRYSSIDPTKPSPWPNKENA